MDQTKRTQKPTDEIGELIRLAGDSAVPPDRMERVRRVTKAHWRSKTGRRSRRRAYGWMAVAAAAAAAALATIAFVGGLFDTTPIERASLGPARVESVGGRTVLESGSGTTPLAVGAEVPAGTTVSTAAASGLALRLPDGHSLRLDQDSAVELRTDGSLELLAGAMYLESDAESSAKAVDVHTPYGMVREIGTQFEARLRSHGLRIRLREGAVRLERRGEIHTVEAGGELAVDASGRTETRPIDTHGEAWDWVSAVAPVPDMNGRSAHEFLAWVAREKGWKLAFDDAEALQAAREAIVEGRLERFTVEEALAVVTRASRLQHRVVGGNLIVSAMR